MPDQHDLNQGPPVPDSRRSPAGGETEERQAQRTAQRLRFLSDAARDLLEISDPLEWLERTYKRLAAAFDLDFYFHFAGDAPGDPLRLSACQDISPEQANEIESSTGKPNRVETIKDVEPIVIADAQMKADASGETLRRLGIAAYAYHPLILNGRVFGTLTFGSRQQGAFTPELLENVRAVSNMLATAIDRRRAEEGLAKSAAQFQLVVEAAPNGMVMVDEEGTIVVVNSQMERLFGYERSEMLGQQIEMLLPDRFRGAHPGQREAFFHSPEARGMGHGRDLFARRKDGSEFPVEVGLNPAKTPEGTFVLAAVIDITERKKTEEALSKSAAQFRLVVEAAPNGMVMVNAKGTIVVVNSAMERLFGYERSEMLGQRIEMLLPERYRASHPAQRGEFFRSPLTRAMGHGRDLFARRKDGSEFPVEVGLNPAETPEGTFVLAAVIDITERKKIEHDLEKSAAQFRLVVESAPNGMVMVNEAGLILMVNSQMERLFGYERSEIVDQPIEILLPERFRNTHPGQRHAFFDSPVTRAMGHGRDLFARRKDGTEFPVEVGLNPAETPDGTVVLASVIDITERKRMEAELTKVYAELASHARNLEGMVGERTEHLQKTIAELEGVSYSLSHDMRAPLRTIRSFAQIVLEDAGDKLGDPEKDLLRKTINAAGRLDRLIKDVLIYSRISRESVDLAPVDVEQLLRQIIDERPEFQAPEAKIAIEAPLEPVCGHEAYLTQCITNLLGNAVKFVAPGVKPRVRIWSEHGGDSVKLFFEDNGIGIPEGVRERMFGIFQRVHNEKTYPGTGIGLAIVRKAVERMGGSIGVESEPGRGSRFWLQLPPT